MAINTTIWKMEKNDEITEKTKVILKGQLITESARSDTLFYKEQMHCSDSLNAGRFEQTESFLCSCFYASP